MVSNEKINSLILHSVLGIAAVLGLVHLVVASLYSVPNPEDIMLSLMPILYGKFVAIIDLLLKEDSRFLTNTLHSYNILVAGYPKLYFIQPLICIFLFISSFTVLFRALLPNVHMVKVFMYGTFVFILYMGTTPSTAYSLFFMSGTFTYSYPSMCWLVWVGAFIQFFVNGSKFLMPLFCFMLFFLLSFGGSEIFIGINFFSLAGLLALLYVHSKTSFWRALYIGGGVFVLALFVVLLMPSNRFLGYGEVSGFNQSPDIGLILKDSFEKNVYFLRKGFLTLTFFIGSFCLGAIIYPNTKSPIFRALAAVPPIKIVAFFLILIFGISLPFIISSTLQELFLARRIFNLTHLVVLVFVFLGIGAILVKQERLASFLYGRKAILICALFLLTFFESGNNFSLIRTEYFSGQYDDVVSKYAQFYKNANNVQGQQYKSVVFENPGNPPVSNYFQNDILPNRKNKQFNKAMELYFNIDELRLEGD